MNTQKIIKVLIVDDSELVRSILSKIFSSDPEFEVVGVAVDPYDAREKIKQLSPDVITLDVEMPRMDGITFLKNIMRLRPLPVVMISTLTEKGADTTLEALEIGAVDFVAKPKLNADKGLADQAEEIIRKVRQAAAANIDAIEYAANIATSVKMPHPAKGQLSGKIDLIAIGASTGGPEAVKIVLQTLPAKNATNRCCITHAGEVYRFICSADE